MNLTTQSSDSNWIDELARRVIDELHLDADELYYLDDSHLDVNPFKAQKFGDYVRELSGDQILELTASVQHYNSAPVQEALRGLHIDLSGYTAGMIVDAAAKAALLLWVTKRIQPPAPSTA